MWVKEAQEYYKQNSRDDSGRSSEDKTTNSNVRRKDHGGEISKENKDPTWFWTRYC